MESSSRLATREADLEVGLPVLHWRELSLNP